MIDLRVRDSVPLRRAAPFFAGIIAGICGVVFISGWLFPRISLQSPEATFLFLDRHWTFISEQGDSHDKLGFWPEGSELPPLVRAVVLAAEDRRFAIHGGIDWLSAGRALVQNMSAGETLSGASTIAMQVARMQDPGSRTIMKKLGEALVAVLITSRYGRRVVLRHYLRIVPFGNRIHGITYAARRYFRKPVADLSLAQASVLAAVPKAPGRMNLFSYDGMEKAKDRAALILRRLDRFGWIDSEEYDFALHELSDMKYLSRKTRPVSCMHALLRLDDIARSAGIEACGGPIRTSLDLDLQLRVHDTAWRHVENLRQRGVENAAVLVAEVESGAIRAYVGSVDYFDSSGAGAIDYVRTPRSSGSILKPFIFALGMTESGFTGATILDDLALYLDTGNGIFSASNFDGRFLGPMLYRYALANSRNIPAMQVLNDVGVDNVFSRFDEWGIVRGSREAEYYGLGLAVGTLYVTVEDMTGLYSMLANDGKKISLSWFEEGSGTGAFHRLLPEDTARLISLYLSDPMARMPSFQRLGSVEYPFPVAVKTGTSRGYRDSWTFCYSDRYVVGVWMGRADNQPMDKISGSAGAAPLAKEIMLHLHPETSHGQRDTGFPPPREYNSIRICRLSGKRATSHTQESCFEYFKPGTEPVEYSAAYRPVAVDSRNDLLATDLCPSEFIDIRYVVDLPPRYASWAADTGLPTAPVEYSPLCTGFIKKRPERLSILKPADGSRLVMDPECPERFRTITLSASVDPAVSDIVWYVDGYPYKIATYPYTIRWHMKPGEHSFQAICASTGARSRTVTVTVSG